MTGDLRKHIKAMHEGPQRSDVTHVVNHFRGEHLKQQIHTVHDGHKGHCNKSFTNKRNF